MPTIVNRVVKYSGGDYTTLAAAFAAIPADIRAGTGTDEQWNILIDESAAGVYEWDLGSFGPTLSGKLTNATNYIKIAANTGKSFRDNANKLTNALTYNAANGIALKATNVVLYVTGANFTQIEGIQFLRSGTTVNSGEHALYLTSSVSLSNCIVKSNATAQFAIFISTSAGSISNSVILSASSGVYCEFGVRFSNATIVRTASVGGDAIASNFGPPTVKNLAAFGFSAILGGGDTSFNAASSNNATDLASGPTNWGSGSLVSKTFSNQFQSITSGSEDFRVKAGADLINAGVRDQTYTNDLDIVGTTRSTTTPNIGAWEFLSVAYTYARPSSDITTQWTPSAGTDHYALIDESTANDSDYIYATAAGQTDEVKLASMSAPQAGTSLLINYRVQGIVGGASVTLSLVCNTTVIATDTARTANGDYTLTVASGIWASVTDWTNMRLRFVSA
jgi:hypothetical protein